MNMDANQPMGGFPFTVQRDPDDPDAGDVIVTGTVNGRATSFILDTGAAVTSLREDACPPGSPIVGTRSSGGVFGRSQDELVLIDELQVGPIVRRPVTVARSSHPRARNLIGMDILKDFRIHFDFAKCYCSLGGEVLEAREELAMDGVFHPYVPVKFGAITASAVWDSGAGITVVDMAFVAGHQECFAEVGRSLGTDSTGAQMDTPVLLMKPSMIGGVAFPEHRVVGVDLSVLNQNVEIPVNMILGYSTLSPADWVFDFPGRSWGVRLR